MESDSMEQSENDDIKNKSDMETVSSSVPERRKSLKPMMEKRRRARINASLEELKTFLLDVIKKEGLRQNKMEKADILELTVKHMRHLQQRKISGSTKTDEQFLHGFTECLNIVNNFLQSNKGLDPTLQVRLLNHLSNCMDNNDFDGCEPVKGKNETYNTVTTSVSSKGQCLFEKEINRLSDQATLFGNAHIRGAPVNDGNIQSTAVINEGFIQDTSGRFTNNSCQKSKPEMPLRITENVQFCNVGNYVENMKVLSSNEHMANIAYLIPLNVIPTATNVLTNTCLPKYIFTLPSPADDANKSSENKNEHMTISLDKSRETLINKDIESSVVGKINVFSEKESLSKSSCHTPILSSAPNTSIDLSKQLFRESSESMLLNTPVEVTSSNTSLSYDSQCYSNSNVSNANYQHSSKYASHNSLNCVHSSPNVASTSAGLRSNSHRQELPHTGNIINIPEVNHDPVWRPW